MVDEKNKSDHRFRFLTLHQRHTRQHVPPFIPGASGAIVLNFADGSSSQPWNPCDGHCKKTRVYTIVGEILRKGEKTSKKQ